MPHGQIDHRLPEMWKANSTWIPPASIACLPADRAASFHDHGGQSSVYGSRRIPATPPRPHGARGLPHGVDRNRARRSARPGLTRFPSTLWMTFLLRPSRPEASFGRWRT